MKSTDFNKKSEIKKYKKRNKNNEIKLRENNRIRKDISERLCYISKCTLSFGYRFSPFKEFHKFLIKNIKICTSSIPILNSDGDGFLKSTVKVEAGTQMLF